MATKVGEFFIDLAVDAASGNLSVNQLVSSLGKLDVASITTVGIVGKITNTLWDLAKAATGTAVEMSVLSDITDVDPKIAQQWEKAAQRMNIHSGAVIKAIMAVHEMNKKIAAGEGTPAVISKLFGLDPTKVDASGKRVLKDAIDYIKELASDESVYQQRGRLIQQKGLGDIFGGVAPDVFRMIEGIRSGEFQPSKISVLENEQVEQLSELRKQRTEIGQQMTGIFNKFLTGGERFSKVLSAISGKLEAIDKWIASKQGRESLDILGREITAPFRYGGDPFAMGKAAGEFIGERLFPRVPVPLSTITGIQADPGILRAILDINWNVNGNKTGETQIELDNLKTNRKFWDASETGNNTP